MFVSGGCSSFCTKQYRLKQDIFKEVLSQAVTLNLVCNTYTNSLMFLCTCAEIHLGKIEEYENAGVTTSESN